MRGMYLICFQIVQDKGNYHVYMCVCNVKKTREPGDEARGSLVTVIKGDHGQMNYLLAID